MDGDRVAQFTEAYRNFKLFPLQEPDKIEKFFVPYGERAILELRRQILRSETNDKFMFTGHRGCGKSTLLVKLDRELFDQGFFVSRFSIAEMVEYSDVNHINILYSIALQLLSQASKLRVPIAASTKTTLTKWFTQTKSRTYSEQLNQAWSLGGDLLGVITGKLQSEQAFREEIKENYQKRVSELAKQIDLIAAAIQTTMSKEVVVLIDDLDKLDLAVVRAIFEDNIRSLMAPNIRVVFTIPIAVVREPKLMTIINSESKLIMLPVPKLFNRNDAHVANAVPIEASMKLLESVLKKRLPDELIEPEIRREMVLLSGGLLRELVRLGRECCDECLLEMELNPDRKDMKVDSEILAVAAKNLRNDFARGLGTNLYNLLVETYKNFTPTDIKSADFLELLHGLYVLEYENDDLWYDLHPLVTDLLRRRQLI